ncbi:MAG: hypothetical protein QNJ92_06715 [Alphaproteobacteria bacterium]|nr:hypothetical protein [Alphaproteobacteria bacterium]
MRERSEFYQRLDPSTEEWVKVRRKTGKEVERSDERFEGVPDFSEPKKAGGW